MNSKKTIVYVDESGFAHDMPKTHGYAPVGVRCFGKHEWNPKDRTNVIGALLNNKLLSVALVDGSVDAEVFLAWFRHELFPELPDKSVGVMDNAAFHKSDDIKAAIISCGHELEFLPNYSSGFN